MKHGMPEGPGDGPSSSSTVSVCTGGTRAVRAPADPLPRPPLDFTTGRATFNLWRES